MTAFKTILAGSVAAAALVSAAPAAAQYYPQPGYGGGVVGQVINQVLGGGAYGGGYGMNSQAAIDRCAVAVAQRVNRDFGYRQGAYSPYGGYGGYGGYAGAYGNYPGGARVLGITSVERRSSGGLRVRGVATANANAGYGAYGSYGGYGGYGSYGGYNQPAPAELSFKCNVDYRGYITDIDVDRNAYAYGYRR